ncbi:MAG: lamin tail domain-containing protein [Verrucomicrobiales bacterium]
MFPRLFTFLLLVLAATPLRAGLVLSEIMYHPVEKAAFDAAGDPVFDLTDDIHEFIEIHNPDGAPVTLGGWKLSGGIDFTFPNGVSIGPGQFLVIARNPARIAAVYGLAQNQILGPWSGGLGNSGDTVRLENSGGTVIDALSYSPASPWAVGADGLGADDEWIGLNSMNYQYKGRSLERVSFGSPANDPANWLASPLSPGPSPGTPNAISLAVPRPVVVAQSAVQDSSNSAIIRANQLARIEATFSAAATGVSNVSVEYFKDDINQANEAKTTVGMAPAAGRPGVFTCQLPGQIDRSVMRYRIKADRGAGTETVSPRPDDPLAWHGYFVMPVRASANPIYDIFVSSASLSTLAVNISQSPRRITNPDPPGNPRAAWNATEPGIFIGPDGVVREMRIRHHGSRYNRNPSRRSWKYQFPRYTPFEGRESYFAADKGEEHRVGAMLYEAADLPVWRARYIDVYQNGDARLQRLRQDEMDADLHRRWSVGQAAKFPGSDVENVGEFYKATGVIPFENGNGQNTTTYIGSGEGPYYIGNCAPAPAKLPFWTSRQRYDWTYGLQMRSWIGGRDIEQMINGLWSARGDTPTSPIPNLTALRSWLSANFDVDATLTCIAIRNWSSPFDNATHNYFLWRRANGRWVLLPWDLDGEFGNISQSIYWDEQANPQPDTLRGPQWLKDSFLKAFREEYKHKLWILNNSLLLSSTFPSKGWTALQGFANSRNTNVNGQLALGTYYRPNTPTAVAPAAGASVLPGASLQVSAYSHGAPANPPTHSSTTWFIRTSGGTYSAPVVRLTSSTNLTSLLIPFDDLAFGQTYFWKCLYTDSQGHPSFESTERSFAFGNSNPPPAGALRLNEILARGSSAPDFIELHNTGATAIELSGMGLTDDPAAGAKLVFPAATALAPGGFYLVTLGQGAAFQLDNDGQTVVLLDATGGLADAVTFGPQARDLSLGRGAGAVWELEAPTPGSANQPLGTSAAAGLRLNEWMASDSNGPDWFEVYNTSATPVALGGLKLGNGTATTALPALSFIAGHGFQKFIADRDPGADANHVNFRLSSSGETITLTDAADVAIDTVTFGSQTTDVSQGRLADGTANIISFPGNATPEEPNAKAVTGLVINALAPDVWLLNTTATPLVIDGWWLSDSLDDLHKYQIPAGGGIIPAGQELAFDDDELPFVLNPVHGGTIYLSHDDTHRLGQEFGAYDGHTYGRIATSTSVDFVRLVNPTVPHIPQVGPVVISEINYHPPDMPGDDDDYEFVELLNISASTVDLSGWKVAGGVDFVMPNGTQLGPGARLCVAGIAPASFDALYDLPVGAAVLGPYDGKLDNGGGFIELIKALPPVTTPGPDFGFIPEVAVERVEFDDTLPWPADPDGTGTALMRINAAAYGNEPLNWAAGAPSPGAAPSANQPPTVGFTNPTNNAQIPVGQQVALTASATDPDGTVKLVEFFVDGEEIAQVSSAPFTTDWLAAAPGPHTFTARAVDGRLAITSSAPVTITVVNNAPTVALTTPTPGTFTHPANIALTATAADGDGGVTRVEFLANGVKIGEDINGAPWTFNWTGASRGTYALTARAIDAYDAAAMSPAVNIYVLRNSILAYVVPAGNVGTQSFSGGLGMDFDVLHPVVVTRLGVFDSAGNGLASTLTVQLFRRAPTVAILAALTFNAADPGVLAAGTASRVKPLPAALVLAPGQYSIVGYGHNSTDLNDNVSTRGSKPWRTDEGNGLLAFVGAGRYGGSPGQLPPTPDGGPADRYAAGTFEYTPLDNDEDGLPYDWEIANGLDPNNTADASIDNDGDTQSNRDEYLAGSNPNDRSSVFKVDFLNPPGVTLRFPVFPNRTATVQWSPDLTNWTTLQTIAPAANPRTIDVTDAAPGPFRRYYRVTAAP